MQLQVSDAEKELRFSPSFPKRVLSRSPSCNSSSIWSLASVPYRSPDSAWEAESVGFDIDDYDNTEQGWEGSAEDDEEEVASPQCEQIVVEIADTIYDDSSLSVIETADTMADDTSASSKSSPSSPGSQIREKCYDVTPIEKISQSQQSSPRVFRMVSERAQLSRLGFQYRYGCGPFPQNLSKSSKFYSEAAGLGCGDALAALAVAHIFGIGVSRSLEEARPMLRNALLKGSIDALEVRALCFMTRTFDQKRNYNSCLELLTMGVARNAPACLLWAGFCFEVGLGTDPDPYAAKAAYLAAGESSTMTNLVHQMLPGAMNSKDPWALMKAALFLLHSSGDPSHQEDAVDCLKKAAELGFPDAQLYLAICLIQGKWLQKDNCAALHWLKTEMKSYEPHPIAERILQQLDGLGSA